MLLYLSWIASSVFFSTSYIGASVLAKYSMPFEYMMFYRLMMASIILMIVIVACRHRLKIYKTEILPSMFVASSQLGVWLSACGTKYTISGILACVAVLQIFIAELLASFVEKRKMRSKIVISGVIGFIGVSLLCNQQLVGVEKTSVQNTILGVILALVAAFISAVGNMMYEKNSKILSQMSKLTFLLYNCLFAGFALLLIGMIVNPISQLWNPAMMDVKYLGVMSYLSITATIIALLAMYYIIAKQGAVKATYMNFVLPVLSMLISTIAEGFRWNIIAVGGMIILLYSVWIGVHENVIQERQKRSLWKRIVGKILKKNII